MDLWNSRREDWQVPEMSPCEFKRPSTNMLSFSYVRFAKALVHDRKILASSIIRAKKTRAVEVDKVRGCVCNPNLSFPGDLREITAHD